MPEHKKFKYDSLEELKKDASDLGAELPFASGVEPLLAPLTIAGKTLPNRIVAQPMEGCDGETDGSPSELTVRRYRRFAQGGAGMLWFEATSVAPEGKANPRQLLLTRTNQDAYKRMLESALREAQKQFGPSHTPFTILQLTHSGRYSRPVKAPQPIIAVRNPYLDPRLADGWRIISDDELQALEDRYVECAEMARDAGFDAVDIKSCHRYLNSELLSAHTREGRYGGSLENRTRFLMNIFDKIRDRVGAGLSVSLRMNAYDAMPYPYGWGVDREDYTVPDLSEPLQLVASLRSKGLAFLNVTAGNPYYNPHVTRPYNAGPYRPREHQLTGAHRLLSLARKIQGSYPDVAVVGTGLSWLNEYAALLGAGGVQEKWFSLAGFGRALLAYPDFPADLMNKGGMEKKKCCIACSKCSELMRYDGKAGCVIYDSEVYRPIYKEVTEGKPSLVSRKQADHV